MNSHMFYERPSPDGTVPEVEIGMGDILSDTSSEPDSDKEEEKVVEEVKIKISSLSPEEQ